MLTSWMLICALSTFCFTMLFTAGNSPKERREESGEELPEEIT